MTFCLGITVADGLIGMADTRITQGPRKITVHDDSRHRMFIMTSGLRSVRDKVLTYFNETLEDGTVTFDKLYRAANAFSEQSVSYPMDVFLCLPRRDKIQTHRYLRADLDEPASHWNWKLRNLVENPASDWLDPSLDGKSGDNVTTLSMPPFDR